MRYAYLIVLLLNLVCPVAYAAEGSFAHDVAPVLARRCLSCHDDANAKGDVSFELAENLINDGYIDSGDSSTSHLIELITPIEGQAEMPKDSDPLKASEITAIRKWIDAGAVIPKDYRIDPPTVADLDWWSLHPIERTNIALTSAAIDDFVDRKLDHKKLHPLPQATPETLIRRVTYDLTGLPPTPGQIDAFVLIWELDSELAWSGLVNRLLDSPEFGEKWGQHWLDVARYAETHGYDKDQPRRNAWPYRDYVINSFNNDKPVGDFVREQIAGDVRLPGEDGEGVVATGFLAAGPWDLIAHVEVGEDKLDGRIAKHLDRDEMATAVFNVFQSTTIQCAQCHNHKFDPILSEDYYRVHAVFAGIDRADRVFQGQTKAQSERSGKLKHEIASLKTRRNEIDSRRQAAIAKATREIDLALSALGNDGTIPVPAKHGFHSLIESSADQQKWIEVDLGKPRRIRQIELIACFDRFNNIGEGFGFPVRLKVEVTGGSSFGKASRHVLLDATDQDYTNPGAVPIELPASDEPIQLIRITATKLAERQNDYIFAMGEIRAMDRTSGLNVAANSTIRVSDSIPANDRWNPAFAVDETYYGSGQAPDHLKELATLNRQRAKLADSIPVDKSLKSIDETTERLQRDLDAIPKGQFVYAVTHHFASQSKFRPMLGKVRPIHVLHRGDLRSPGKRVLPGAPQLWPGGPRRFVDVPLLKESTARAMLANYVTGRGNPLLWRSMANRIWQWTFGSPIVGTPNDFGRMGMRPTHPELLEFLAASLRDDPNQSIKTMARALVSTRAYRRASYLPSHVGTPSNADLLDRNSMIDNNNELLWRSNRRRLTAEEFRDTVLATSGALRTDERGGPSFQDFVVKHPQHSPHYEYDLHDPEDTATHRRSIYRFVVRSQPQPMMTTLDCADPSISVARRDESTTALQALSQWNSRLVESMSRRFAARLKVETKTFDDQIELATRLAWGRGPTDRERDTLQRLLVEHGTESLCRVILNASALSYLD